MSPFFVRYSAGWTAPLAALAALAGSVALMAGSPHHRRAQVLRFVLVAGPALVLLTPAIEILAQMAQPRPGNLDSDIPAVVFAPFLLAGAGHCPRSDELAESSGKQAGKFRPIAASA